MNRIPSVLIFVAVVASGMIVSALTQHVNGQGSPLSNVNRATESAIDKLNEQQIRQESDQMLSAASNILKAQSNAQEGILGHLKP